MPDLSDISPEEYDRRTMEDARRFAAAQKPKSLTHTQRESMGASRLYDIKLESGRVIVTLHPSASDHYFGNLYTVEKFDRDNQAYSRTERLTKKEALRILADYIQADVMEED
jgi:hypothetical protein